MQMKLFSRLSHPKINTLNKNSKKFLNLFALIIKAKERKNTENFPGIWTSSTKAPVYIPEQFPQFEDFDTQMLLKYEVQLHKRQFVQEL